MSSTDPETLAAELRQRIIGQDDAVRRFAAALAMHLDARDYSGAEPLQKMNVLLVGPTGVGKTELVRRAAELIDAPFTALPATAMTQPGFTGFDPDQLLVKLIQKAKGKDRARYGICYIDEIDKTARRGGDSADQAKGLATGVGLQHALLDIIGGDVVEVLGQGPFDTKGVLFVLSGAFVDLEWSIARRLQAAQMSKPTRIDRWQMLRQVESRDLVAYGMIPELVGRMPVIIPLRPLLEEDIVRILTEPRGAPVRQMVARFALRGVRLECEGSWLIGVARSAVERDTGARALLGVLSDALADAYVRAQPGQTVRVSGIESAVQIEGAPTISAPDASDRSSAGWSAGAPPPA